MCLHVKPTERGEMEKIIIPKNKPRIGYKIFLLSGKDKLYAPYTFEKDFANDNLTIYRKRKGYCAVREKEGCSLAHLWDEPYGGKSFLVTDGLFHYSKFKKDIMKEYEIISKKNWDSRYVICECAFWDFTVYGYEWPMVLWSKSKIRPKETMNESSGASKWMRILKIIKTPHQNLEDEK